MVLYGDNNNWFAAWALWQIKLYGHKDVRLMNGGRKKWLAEGRELTTDAPSPARASYRASGPDLCLRAFLAEAMDASANRTKAFVDVRSPDEFTGKILRPRPARDLPARRPHPGRSQHPLGPGVQRGWHLQGLRRAEEPVHGQASPASKPMIAYCRIGERSSHTWFVLKYLLGYDNVKNYDGSWTEWGNLVGVPVERGAQGAS